MRRSFWLVALLLAAPVLGQTPPGTRVQYTVTTPSQVASLTIAHDGKSMVGLCKDGLLRRWNLPSGRLDRTFADIGRIYLFLTSGDGRWVLAGNNQGEVVAWDTSSGTEIFRTHMLHYPAAGFLNASANPSAFSHSARYLALAPAGEAIQLLDWPGGKKRFSLASPAGGSSAIAFSRDDSRIATADNDGVIRIYDTSTGKLLAHYDGFLLEPFAVDFTPDGKRVVAAGADKSVIVLDAASGKLTRTLARFADPVGYVEISPDGKRVAVILGYAEDLSLPAPVSFWDLASGTKESEWKPSTVAVGASWLPDGHWMLATSEPSAVKLWRFD